MALLYRTNTINQLWALLEGYSPFTTLFAETRRIPDTPEGWLKKLVLRSAGDFPHIGIEMGDRFGGSGPAFTVFDNESASPGGAWDEERTSEFQIKIVYEKPGFSLADELEMTVIEAIESGGRNLGYAPIKKWGPWQGRRNGNTTIPGTEDVRPVTQIILPVVYEFSGSQLTPT